MRRKNLWPLVLLLSFIATETQARSAQVTTTGYGDSRQQALTDARRAAVESDLEVLLKSESYTRDYIMQSDRVRSVSSGVVTSFAIKSEKQDDTGMWSVAIDAIVDSDKLKVTERFTLTSAHTMNYEATLEDPTVFTRPWAISMPIYKRVPPDDRLMQFNCVEFVEELMYGHLRKHPLP